MRQHHTIFVAAALCGALSLPASAQTKPSSDAAAVTSTAPGQVRLAQTVVVTARIDAIDAQAREITVTGPKGNQATLAAGPDVRSFDKVKVGDMVAVRYVEALSLTLMKGGQELRSSTENQGGARAAAGKRPAGLVGRQIEITADVVAIDAKTHLVTLRGPKQSVDLVVEDPEQLKLVKVGDQVKAVYTQAVAISVEPASAAK